ncbi:hypothetical protein PCANC_23753 [Puccinia coronata f. sp. avenae]|uniref:Uncharacterized protein n=1 Tax=Puccinia coronata f. sp. avenae TaxID=200324 RepID=A0A2N5UAX6_9BASI|nr:hypothetical protein PCANC_23753 [Puccinia coronata f. sp. avenae]
MRKISERQFAIRELFMMLVLLQLEETDCLVDAALNLPSIPTLGSIISPNDASKQLIFALEFEDSARVADLLRYVLSNRYLHDRLPARTRDEFNLGQLFDMRENDFKQAVRTTKSGFLFLLEKIYLHYVFYSNSRQSQLPIPHQLALTLERIGSNGNGASVG